MIYPVMYDLPCNHLIKALFIQNTSILSIRQFKTLVFHEIKKWVTKRDMSDKTTAKHSKWVTKSIQISFNRLNKNFPKSHLGFEKWTFFLSNFQKGNYFIENDRWKTTCDHIRHKLFFEWKKVSWYFFYVLCCISPKYFLRIT